MWGMTRSELVRVVTIPTIYLGKNGPFIRGESHGRKLECSVISYEYS